SRSIWSFSASSPRVFSPRKSATCWARSGLSPRSCSICFTWSASWSSSAGARGDLPVGATLRRAVRTVLLCDLRADLAVDPEALDLEGGGGRCGLGVVDDRSVGDRGGRDRRLADAEGLKLLRLWHDPDVGLRRFPALRIDRLGLVVADGTRDDDVLALFPVGRGGDAMLGGHLQRIDRAQD